MKALLSGIAVVFTLSSTAGIAQTPSQMKSDRSAKEREAERLRQARLKHFGRVSTARSRFLRQHMTRSWRQGTTAEKQPAVM
jgi:hypothetical protein